MKEMEKLLLAIENEENFGFCFKRKDKKDITFYGREEFSKSYSENNCIVRSEYCIAESWGNNSDFTMHFIHKLEDVKNFICKKYSQVLWDEICKSYESQNS